MSDVPSPKATRQSRPKWLDPKLFLGILLVLGSMALGARLIGQYDNTSTVYVAKQDIAPNGPVSADVLESTEVRFPVADDANKYIRASEELKKGTRAVRGIGAGELVPRGALSNKADEKIVDFPVQVSGSRMPSGLKAHDLVDVILQPREGQATDTTAEPESRTALTNVVVISAPDSSSGAVSGDSAVTLRVDTSKNGIDLNAFYGLASVNDVVLVRSSVQSN